MPAQVIRFRNTLLPFRADPQPSWGMISECSKVFGCSIYTPEAIASRPRNSSKSNALDPDRDHSNFNARSTLVIYATSTVFNCSIRLEVTDCAADGKEFMTDIIIAVTVSLRFAILRPIYGHLTGRGRISIAACAK